MRTRCIRVFRINYLPPEHMPAYERDFPRKGHSEPVPGNSGSGVLALLVVSYLLVVFGGILLLVSIGEHLPGLDDAATAEAQGTKTTLTDVR
jgi:hypothetical protein